ncbi:hypothetical protein ACLB2K_025022 [Fragaria x ananassa]
MFSGTVPPEIGKLVSLQILIISANNLTGILPVDLTNLTKLIELRISSNNFTGCIPDFFRKRSKLVVYKAPFRLAFLSRDIKTTNVLLDQDLNAKISDFGLAKLDEEENTHISTRVAGTIGYMAPEYALWGCLTYKADVYSFGVVALETVSGKNNMKYRPNENIQCLIDWALVLHQKGNLLEMVDPRLGSDFNKKEALRTIKVALLCANPTAAVRPIMSAVVSMLEGRTLVDEVALDPSIQGDEMTRLRAFENLSEQNAKGAHQVEVTASCVHQMHHGLVLLILLRLL